MRRFLWAIVLVLPVFAQSAGYGPRQLYVPDTCQRRIHSERTRHAKRVHGGIGRFGFQP